MQQTKSLATSERYSLRELEVVVGKLRYVAQLCPPLLRFLSSSVQVMKQHIILLSPGRGDIPTKERNQYISSQERDHRQFHPTEEMRVDLMMMTAILVDTYHYPLPIMDPEPAIPLHAVPIYTDASGNIGSSTFPSLGIFFPPFDGTHSAAFAIPFTTVFCFRATVIH